MMMSMMIDGDDIPWFSFSVYSSTVYPLSTGPISSYPPQT